MAGILNDILLKPGNLSWEEELGEYYQDISPSLAHIENGVFATLDDSGIPYCIEGKARHYYPVAIIQYGLMHYDLYLKKGKLESHRKTFESVVNYIDNTKVLLNDSYVWPNKPRKQYKLNDGWISGMVQGQAISLFLRAFQLTKDNKYLHAAEKALNSFHIPFENGGFKRIDENGCVWYEEYPTENPSYVLNGFIYAILGVLDYYRVTENETAKRIWDESLETLKQNVHKYDVWYWSIYDQAKKQLVSYYYQKNVHIPLMQILYGLTNDELFHKYALKWDKNLNNPLHRMITKVMYRVHARLRKTR